MGQIIHEDISAEEVLAATRWIVLARLLSTSSEKRTKPVDSDASHDFVYDLMSWKARRRTLVPTFFDPFHRFEMFSDRCRSHLGN
jgi:hypothetical protein